MIAFLVSFMAPTDWSSCQDGHILDLLQWQTWHTIYKVFVLKAERHGRSCDFLLSCISCLQFVPLWCIALKSISETHFPLLLWIHLTLVYVSWDFMHWDVQHTPTLIHWRTRTQRRTGWNTHLYVYTNTPSMQCSKYNDCILALFSSGWWQVFFSTHMVEMKSNYICNGSPTPLLLWRRPPAWVTTVRPKCAQ